MAQSNSRLEVHNETDHRSHRVSPGRHPHRRRRLQRRRLREGYALPGGGARRRRPEAEEAGVPPTRADNPHAETRVMKPHVVTFTESGEGHCLYTEAIDLASIGRLTMRRATSIEF